MLKMEPLKKEAWKRLKNEWDKIGSILIEAEKMKKFQNICRCVILKRIKLSQASNMIDNLNAEISENFVIFLFEICSCFELVLECGKIHDENEKIKERNSIINSLVALKLLEYDLPPLDENSTTLIQNPSILNILLKNMMENVVKSLFNSNEENQSITARDFLDSFVLNQNANSLQYKDSSFVQLKKNLVQVVESNMSVSSKPMQKYFSLIKNQNNDKIDKEVISFLLKNF